MTNATQDPKRPHVWWYPQPERLIINAAKCATPDPRDARLAELTTALRDQAQQIADAVSHMPHEDNLVDKDDVHTVIVGTTGWRCDDDSLWFSGAEWQAAIGEREERIAALTTALRRIRTMAGDAPTLTAMALDPAMLFDAIAQIAANALAAMPEPSATVEVMAL